MFWPYSLKTIWQFLIGFAERFERATKNTANKNSTFREAYRVNMLPTANIIRLPTQTLDLTSPLDTLKTLLPG